MILDWMKQAKSVGDDPVTGFDQNNLIVSQKVEINAPAKTVWAVLTNLEKYSDWNPFCVRAESTLEMGAPVHMKLVNYANPGILAPNCEYVCAFEPEVMLSWELPHSDFWPYPARRDQLLEATGPNSCSYVSTDAFLGENGVHVMRFCGDWVTRAFNDTAIALKVRAEEMHNSASGS